MLTKNCDALTGVGPALFAKLAQCGIHTVQDLLLHLPFRYQDRTSITPIGDLRANTWSVIVGHVQNVEIKTGKRTMLSCSINDDTGSVTLRFFNFNRSLLNLLQRQPFIRAFGEVRTFANNLELAHPEYQILDSDQPYQVEENLTPIYTSTHGLSQAKLRLLVKQALDRCKDQIENLEWMTPSQLKKFSLQSIKISLTQLHNPAPDTPAHLLEQGQHPAIKRLAFDELLAQQLSLRFARKQRALLCAPRLIIHDENIIAFLKQLPFQLTSAQKRVSDEVAMDLQQDKPMLRLVQGDVGSGKTVVAALAALQAISAGFQVALMAPTDILTEQHAQNFVRWFEPLGIKVCRLSGKMTAKARRETLSALSDQTCSFVIGTHALFQDDVSFSRLGLVMIDEQHRFGVEQRLSLQQKGQNTALTPHQLLLTATPIPRTLAMTHHAHLDISIIDELPAGRSPVNTTVLHHNKREGILARLNNAIALGRQIYWVCTLIEESETIQCTTAVESARSLQEYLPNARVGLIHGRLKTTEKENIMAAFKLGAIDILVATTVIEVGVDVPNASLMIIENAERLGLSQLHQLRGRVGRGTTQSHCVLLYQPPLSYHSMERLRVMRETCDGFIIAEKDLELRGRGELLGKRQTGYRTFKIADPQRDQDLLTHLPKIASHLLEYEPEIANTIAQRWLGECASFLDG